MITETKENQTQTGLKNFKPKINLNHNIYMFMVYKGKIIKHHIQLK